MRTSVGKCTGIQRNHQQGIYPAERSKTGTLAIYNLNGSIKVEGYSGNEVIFKVDKTISASNAAVLETGKKEFRLEFEQNEDSIIAYIAEPFDTRPHSYHNRHGQYREIKYDFKLDFTVRVPYDMNLDVSTINEGVVVVENVNGNLNIHNVNGAVTLNNAKGTTNAGTVNGDVTVSYLTNPSGNSSYNTINGDIKVEYRSGSFCRHAIQEHARRVLYRFSQC